MDTEHKGTVITITEQTGIDPKPYALAAASIGLEGIAAGIALACGRWPQLLLFLALDVLFAVTGWRAVDRAGMRRTECREYLVDGCHNLIIAGDGATDNERTRK